MGIPLEKPTFSHGSGFYSGVLTLAIHHPDPEAVIYYTLDGSDPGPHSLRYLGPVFLEKQRSDDTGINMIRTNPPEADAKGFGWKRPAGFYPKATVVRAIALRPGYYTPSATFASYFIEMPVPGLPVSSMIIDPYLLFDHHQGIYIPGVDYEQGGWGAGWYGQPNANYYRQGDRWEIPGYLDFLVGGKRCLPWIWVYAFMEIPPAPCRKNPCVCMPGAATGQAIWSTPSFPGSRINATNVYCCAMPGRIFLPRNADARGLFA